MQAQLDKEKLEVEEETEQKKQKEGDEGAAVVNPTEDLSPNEINIELPKNPTE